MSDRTYRVTEIVGSSPDGVDQAIHNGIARASQTLRNLDWFEVTQVRGAIENGRITHYQVGLKVGFRLEDGEYALAAEATGDDVVRLDEPYRLDLSPADLVSTY